jgi:hypothetical protein
MRDRVWALKSFIRMPVSSPKVPKCTCYAMHAQSDMCFEIQMWWARPRKTSSGLRGRIDHDWHKIFGQVGYLSRNSDLITTILINFLTRSLEEDVQPRHYIDERFWDHLSNTWGYNADELHKRRLLDQPTTKTNPTWLHTLGVPHYYYSRTTRNLITTIPSSN